MSPVRRPRTTRTAAALAGVVLLAGCSTLGASRSTTTTSEQGGATHSPGPMPSHAADLAAFYTQKVDWHSCGNFQCGTLTVPVDYDKPKGATIKLALKRQRSTSSKRQGSLVINPGGPGASGVDMVGWFAPTLAGNVQRHFDIVGFDPRGVAGSSPVKCVDDKGMDEYLGGDPTPDDAAERAQTMAENKKFADACLKNTGELLGHVSTVEAAKDMDVLRAAVGDSKLNFFGASYGTFLGATYADLFPAHVGQMVLDGVIDPAQDGKQSALGQAKGFDRATRAYAAHCAGTGSCPVGSTPDQAMQGIADLLKQIDAQPLPAKGVGPGTLTEGWASMGIALPMYSESLWGQLDEALRKAKQGDGSGLMSLAVQYADRNDDGSYNGNMLQALDAVNCLDRPVPGNADTYLADEQEFTKVSQVWGRFMNWGDAACGVWPVKATGQAKEIHAPGSGPILVLGTTRDPATLYENSVSLAKQLEHGVLVTRDGDGHTAYQQGNNCVDRTVDDYLVKDKVPADGTKC